MMAHHTTLTATELYYYRRMVRALNCMVWVWFIGESATPGPAYWAYDTGYCLDACCDFDE